MHIYVGNIAYSVSESDLHRIFSQYGTVDSARVIRDRESDCALGFGFIEMKNQSEADRAIGHLNGSRLCQRTLVVNASLRPSAENVIV